MYDLLFERSIIYINRVIKTSAVSMRMPTYRAGRYNY